MFKPINFKSEDDLEILANRPGFFYVQTKEINRLNQTRVLLATVLSVPNGVDLTTRLTNGAEVYIPCNYLAEINEPIKFSYKRSNEMIEEIRPKYAGVTSHTCRSSFCTKMSFWMVHQSP